MKIGNILAAIGIILGFLGLICLPLWNLHEFPYMAEPGYPKGGGWIALIQTGIFARPGIILMAVGGFIFLVAKLLPKKYWETSDSYSNAVKERLIRRKNNLKNAS